MHVTDTKVYPYTGWRSQKRRWASRLHFTTGYGSL